MIFPIKSHSGGSISRHVSRLLFLVFKWPTYATDISIIKEITGDVKTDDTEKFWGSDFFCVLLWLILYISLYISFYLLFK